MLAVAVVAIVVLAIAFVLLVAPALTAVVVMVVGPAETDALVFKFAAAALQVFQLPEEVP